MRSGRMWDLGRSCPDVETPLTVPDWRPTSYHHRREGCGLCYHSILRACSFHDYEFRGLITTIINVHMMHSPDVLPWELTEDEKSDGTRLMNFLTCTSGYESARTSGRLIEFSTTQVLLQKPILLEVFGLRAFMAGATGTTAGQLLAGVGKAGYTDHQHVLEALGHAVGDRMLLEILGMETGCSQRATDHASWLLQHPQGRSANIAGKGNRFPQAVAQRSPTKAVGVLRSSPVEVLPGHHLASPRKPPSNCNVGT
ncbi:hypothetical protein QBC40DRAFT_344504 [Triangularia verruculosa]|uniref:Uncharacterized protein n=1 Tax=Triangularia verruculosa TaxID=2587418 RepID=A0AAN6XSE4_9PEZI|nr:hypothetical protein QBC40DRAFT_344504 [Triangularia verruculosa]